MDGVIAVDANANDVEKLQLLTDVLENMYIRHDGIRDPKTRAVLMIDKLSSIFDLMMAHHQTTLRRCPDELRERFFNINRKLKTEMRSLFVWVNDQSSPSFSSSSVVQPVNQQQQPSPFNQPQGFNPPPILKPC